MNGDNGRIIQEISRLLWTKGQKAFDLNKCFSKRSFFRLRRNFSDFMFRQQLQISCSFSFAARYVKRSKHGSGCFVERRIKKLLPAICYGVFVTIIFQLVKLRETEKSYSRNFVSVSQDSSE